jgi:hypothetical protein
LSLGHGVPTAPLAFGLIGGLTVIEAIALDFLDGFKQRKPICAPQSSYLTRQLLVDEHLEKLSKDLKGPCFRHPALGRVHMHSGLILVFLWVIGNGMNDKHNRFEPP